MLTAIREKIEALLKKDGILIAVLVAIFVTTVFDLAAKGVDTVSVLPQGFPAPSFPRVDPADIPILVGTAIGISLVAIGDTISTSAGFASRRGYEIDSDQEMMEKSLERLQSEFGVIDYRSRVLPFDLTDYYVPEMGSPLFRLFIALESLIKPDRIASIKCDANVLENRLSIDGKRKVNLDPGYLDYDKVVLASAKYNGQKIYLAHGIWADLTLHFERGHFHPYPWSFPDFKKGMYDEIFLAIRRLYKQQKRD